MRSAASGRPSFPAAWRAHLPAREPDAEEESNPCFGITLACILSAPVWVALAVVGYSLLP
jgi:hypothetical protein